MSDIGTLLNDLQETASAKSVCGKATIAEDEFYITLERIKKWILTAKMKASVLSPSQRNVLDDIDKFENLVAKSPQFFGTCFVNRKSYQDSLTVLQENRILRPCSAELELFADLRKPFLSLFKVDGFQFFTTMVQLKKKLPVVAGAAYAEVEQVSIRKKQAIQAIDELEKFVCDSQPVLGRVVVNQSDYLQHLEKLKATVLQLEKERR